MQIKSVALLTLGVLSHIFIFGSLACMILTNQNRIGAIISLVLVIIFLVVRLKYYKNSGG